MAALPVCSQPPAQVPTPPNMDNPQGRSNEQEIKMDVQKNSKNVKHLQEGNAEKRQKTCEEGLVSAREKTDAILMPKMDAVVKAENTGVNEACSSVAGSNDGAVADGRSAQQTEDTVPETLLGAALRGDAEALLRQLMAGADVRQHDKHGFTALHLAATHGHLHAASVLVGFGAPLNLSGYSLRTPLHCAAAHGRLQVAQRLLDAGAKVDILDYWGDTALFLAAKNGHEDILALLLHKKASVDACAKSGDTLLVHAAKAKQWGVVQLLLEKGASAIKCKEAKESPLALAAGAGRDDVVRDLLERGAALEKKQVEEALNATGTAAVVWAFAEALSSAEGNPLGAHVMRAAMEGRPQLLAVLLGTGVFGTTWLYPKSKQYPLHVAAANGHLACVEELLQRGAAVDITDSAGNSPLHLASRAGHAHCARALQAAGASTSIRNNKGMTPVDEAKYHYNRGAF